MKMYHTTNLGNLEPRERNHHHKEQSLAQQSKAFEPHQIILQSSHRKYHGIPSSIQKILPSKSTLIAKNKSLNHLLKFDEIGMPSAKGQRFTDRILLGKSNLNSKITGIKVYFDKSNNLIAGIQMTYTGNKKGGDYVKKDKDNKEKQYNEE